MAFKLAVAALVTVPMSFTLTDGGKPKHFNFSLTCERLTQDEWARRCRDDRGEVDEACIKQAITGITTGWNGQTLVLEEDGQPAAFCTEALEVMFSTAGVCDLAVRGYVKEVAAKVKN